MKVPIPVKTALRLVDKYRAICWGGWKDQSTVFEVIVCETERIVLYLFKSFGIVPRVTCNPYRQNLVLDYYNSPVNSTVLTANDLKYCHVVIDYATVTIDTTVGKARAIKSCGNPGTDEVLERLFSIFELAEGTHEHLKKVKGAASRN